MNHGNSLNEYINSIKEDQKNRTRKVIEKITNPMQELKRYNEYLDQLMKRNLIQQIEEVKAYFDKNVIELYYLKKDNINSGRKRKLLKIISSKQREIVSTQINKIHTLNQLSRNINLKYEANKETIYFYLFEQDLSDDVLKQREEAQSQISIFSKPDEFTERIMEMRKEKTHIDSIAEYLPISDISEYEKLESQIEYINKQNIFLSEMRVFIDIYFEFIPDVIHSLKVFEFQNYDVIQKKDNNNQLSLIENNEIDLIKIAYLYIKFNYFRNDFIEEFTIQKQELNKTSNRNLTRPLPEFVDVYNLKWSNLYFYFIYKQFKHKNEDRIATLLEVKAKTKNGIITTGIKDLSYFGFQSRSRKKDSGLFEVLRKLNVGVTEYKSDKNSVLRNNDKCNRFCRHLRTLFPNISDKRPIPKYKQDQFPEPKFNIVDKQKEKAEKELREHGSEEVSSGYRTELYDEFLS